MASARVQRRSSNLINNWGFILYHDYDGAIIPCTLVHILKKDIDNTMSKAFCVVLGLDGCYYLGWNLRQHV